MTRAGASPAPGGAPLVATAVPGKQIVGGFVRLDPVTGIPTRILPFPHDPRTLARRLSAPAIPAPGQEPLETIVFTLKLETDRRNPQPARDGIYPWLSAFELLMYPPTVPGTATPLVVFVWGQRRIIPVRLTEVHVTEESFDAALNPIAAELEATLHVLKDFDQSIGSPGRTLWDVHRQTLEALAAAVPPATLADLGLAGVP